MNQNELPIIPKPLKRYKGTLFMNLTLYDLGILMIGLVVSILTWISLPLNFWLKLVVTVIILSTFISLTMPIKGTKLYVSLFRSIVFLFSKKSYTKKQNDMFNPYKEVEDDGLIRLKSGDYIRPIHVKGFDIHILQEQEQFNRISGFRELSLNHSIQFSIIKLNLSNDLTDQYELWNNKLKEKGLDKTHKAAIGTNLAILNELEEKELNYVDKYFILIQGSKEKIQSTIGQVMDSLKRAFLAPEPTDKKSSEKILKNIYGSTSKENTLIEGDIKIRPKHIKINKTFMRVYAVSSLPRFANVGWLSSLSVNENISWTSLVENFDKAKATKKIDKVIKRLEEKQIGTKKASQETQASAYLQGLYSLNDQVHANGETINSTYTYILIQAGSTQELEKLSKTLVSETISRNITLNPLTFLQKEGFSSFLPKLTNPTRNISSIELSSLALSYGFPFYSQIHRDAKGPYLGYSDTGNNIFFDVHVRSDKRKNSNVIILGTSGSGKSTTSKKLIKDQVLLGNKVFAIDPEREYKKLCESLNGDWINFGSDSLVGEEEITINPLQFLKNQTGERSILSSHIQFLEQFFLNLFPELVLTEVSILKDILLDLYRDFKIVETSLTKDVTSFPTLSDLHALILKKAKAEKDTSRKSIIKNLLIYFNGFTNPNSPESKLWNGHTKFDIHKSDFIVMDIQSLYESGNKRIANAQMFLLLKIVNNAMVQNKILKETKKDKNQQMLIVIDEAHLLIDENHTAALDFMYEMVKRARKYDALTMITTQNIKDFLGGSKEVQKKTSAIVSNSTYAFLLQMNAGDITDLDVLYSSTGGLTPGEKSSLSQAGHGKALLVIGDSDRKILQIDIHDDEFNIWE